MVTSTPLDSSMYLLIVVLTYELPHIYARFSIHYPSILVPMPQELVFPPPEEPSILSLPLPHPDAYPGEPREYALALVQRKDAIQKEIASPTYPAPAKRNANPSRMFSTTYYPQYVYI